MATTNKIVDTRRLAAKGRFGDTKIRNVRGEPSHVSALEAYYMDTAGINPPASNRTIHPKTRLPEYHGKWYTGHPLHHQTGLEILQDIYGAVTGADPIRNIEQTANIYETVTGKDAEIGDFDLTDIYGETEKFITDPKRWTSEEEFAIERQSEDIIAGGLENLQTQYGQYMGNQELDINGDGIINVLDMTLGTSQGLDQATINRIQKAALAGGDIKEGMLAREAELREEKLVSSATATGRKIKRTGDVQRSKFGGAYSGTIESGIEEAKGVTQTTFDIGMKGSQLQAEKSEADFMAGLRKQMNQMLIDYQGATGEAYGGGDLLTGLNTLFDQYSENV